MRVAFLTAAVALVFASLATMLMPPWAVVLAWVAAVGFTALWLAHVWVFTARSIRATAVLISKGSAQQRQPDLWTRRRVIAAFVNVLIFSAAISAFPKSALAQDCNCFSDSDCKCPPDFPQCVYNPTRNEAICCGPNAVGCASPSDTYCCPPGSQCYGSDQCMRS
jgi:hypothetical protein